MCLLIETIRVEFGILFNLAYHQQRMDRARKELWPLESQIKLEGHIILPNDLDQGLYKCRVLYRHKVEKVSFERYFPKSISSLKLISADAIEYGHKWADRSEIQKLFDQRGSCDDILIVRDGYITDASYTNIAFYDSKKWLTPINPLLAGTQRQKLLDNNIIKETQINLTDLNNFQKATLFNAMMPFDPERAIAIEDILK